jgi:hypothetical protein
MLANNPELSEKSGITAEAFMHQQKRALDTVFKSVVSRAAAFGQKASRVIDSTPKSQLDKAAQGIVDVADWHNSCPSDLSTLIQRNEILNIMQARAMAAKCLSQVVVEKLSYPAELEADMDDKYMRGEYLMGSRQHELCTMTTDLGLANANFESIHECAKKQCDLLDGEAKRSNLFECSVAVQSLKKRLDFQSSLDKGFLFAGSTYMDSLELQSLPASPRKVLNHISAETEIDFEYSDARLDANKDAAFNVREKEDGSYSYLANIEVSSYAGDRMEQYETYFDESREKIQLNVINEPSFYIDAVNSFQANAFMSALQPVRKMTMCLSNPNTVLTGVGICYDPLTEMRNLGHTLINAYIAITSGRYINKLFDIGARSIDSRLKDVSGTVKEKKSPLLKKFSNFVRDNGGLVITVTGAGAVLGIPQLIKNFSDSDVDDHYSQVVDTDLFESTEIMVLIGYALASAERAAESSALSSMLWVMLLIPGVVMAFIIPVVPLFSFAIATLLMLTTLFATFIVSPFIFMNVLTATGNDMSAQVKKAGMHWLELMFRGPLLLGGLYFAIKIMSALMPFLLNHSLLGVVVTGNVSDEIGFIAMALELIVYFLLMVMLVFFSMDLITSFHDSLKSILFNSSMAVDGEGDSRTTMNENRKMVQGLLADSRR